MNSQQSNEATVNWLFLDLNSFFASCEQQERPELRNRPVAIVQMMTDSTCAIAASYEAKAYGVKTGTMIWEAKKRCPDLVLVKARQRLYVEYHHRIIEAVDTCLPVEKVCSIDEMGCRLMGRERDVSVARDLAQKVKQTILQKVGERMTCSIGLAPSLFLGKVASDMQKPNGLVVITQNDLPHALYRLALTDIYGIGARMEQRLNRVGIYTVTDLMAAPRQKLRQAWGGITGVLYYELLHGADMQFPSSSQSRSLSHQHVLEPELRTMDGAKNFARHLLAKAAERLRNEGYFCRRLGVGISPANDGTHYWNETDFHETQDTAFLLQRLAVLCKTMPSFKPIKVSVVLLDLIPEAQHQPDLFAGNDRRHRLSPLIDQINRRYGRGAIAFGAPSNQTNTFTGHAAFQRVPDLFEF